MKSPKIFSPNNSLGICAFEIDKALTRHDFDKLDFTPLFHTQWAKDLLKCDNFIHFFDKPACQDSFKVLVDAFKLTQAQDLNDRLLILYLLLIKAKAKDVKDDLKSCTYSILTVLLEIFLSEETKKDFFYSNVIKDLFVELNKWPELIRMCDLSFKLSTEKKYGDELMALYDHLIKLFVDQLLSDLRIVDQKCQKCLVSMLTTSVKQSSGYFSFEQS